MGSKAYKIKVGYVTLTRNEAGKFKVRYRIPSTNQDVRQWLRVLSLQDAKEAAEKINRELLTGKGTFTQKKKPVTIADALETSIRSTKANADTLRLYNEGSKAFQRYLSKKYPQLRLWNDLRPSIVEAWIKEMSEAGKAYDSIRLAMVPVRRASAYWSAEEPEIFRDVVKIAGKRLSISKPPPKQIHILEVARLRAFLDWLKQNSPKLFPIAALAGLAGMRMREALYLRNCDVDLDRGTIQIADTPWHKPKNRGSYRTIPVHSTLLAMLREHLENQSVKGLNETPLFTTRFHEPWKHYGIMNAWKRTMLKAKVKFPWLEGFQPHRLRASFVTMLMQAGCDDRMLKLYIGHTASDVLGQHYYSISAEALQGAIVGTLDRILNEREDRSGRFLANANSIREQSTFELRKTP